jgi:hypothetical protein
VLASGEERMGMTIDKGVSEKAVMQIFGITVCQGFIVKCHDPVFVKSDGAVMRSA